MKKLLLALLIAFSVVALASCGFDGMGNIVGGGNTGNNGDNTSTLDFFLKDDGTYAVGVGRNKYLSKIVIPTTYKGKAVTEIASFFADTGFDRTNSTIKEVVIPDTVTTIGEYAFLHCTSLMSVVIGDSVTSIGDYAFSHCTSLTSVVIPDSVTSIGGSAFYDCDSLTSVVIGDSVTSIGEKAFKDCESLTSIKYRGTKEGWNAIDKGSYWDSYTGRYTITYNYDGE